MPLEHGRWKSVHGEQHRRDGTPPLLPVLGSSWSLISTTRACQPTIATISANNVSRLVRFLAQNCLSIHDPQLLAAHDPRASLSSQRLCLVFRLGFPGVL
jgi:hypothetical protein